MLSSNDKSGFSTGGQDDSRLNDINFEDVDNVEVLKGPAATAIYGSAASNGVLLITTKRGRVGKPQYNAYVEATAIADANTARATLFAERAYWLFNTGHRQGDLRRLARAPYSFATNTVFPSGPFFRGGTYGNDVAFPLPFNEVNNPNFNASACSTTTP